MKNGGRPYNNGYPYRVGEGGGIFICPDNEVPWSSTRAWGIGPGLPGDETTRFPRSYAVNDDAGVNELGTRTPFWPCVGYMPCGQGNIAVFQQPSSTIMIGETRIVFPDIHAVYTSYEVNNQGQPWGGQPWSVIKGHGGGFTDFVFFDGHAKAVNAIQALRSDLWDCFGPNGYGSTYQQNVIRAAERVPEWNGGM